MLRKRQYHYIYSGLNFLSLLWGLFNLRKGKSVLILDVRAENLLQTSAHWGLLNYFEYLSLKQKWLQATEKLAQKEIFIHQFEEFYFHNQVLKLGDLSPFKNLLEIKRRFGYLFPVDKLDFQHFDEVIYKLGKEIFSQLQINGDYIPSKSECDAKPELAFLVELAKSFEKHKDIVLDCLAPSRYYYLFEPNLRENTFLLLVINLLPRFTFSEEKLTQQLRSYFHLAGGEIKRTMMEQVENAQNRQLLQVRIQSIEGMLLTDSLHFFGGTLEEGVYVGDLDVQKHRWSEICLSIHEDMISLPLSEIAKVFLVDESLRTEDFGPVWLRKKDGQVYLYSYHRFRFGFNDKEIVELFYDYLKNIFSLWFNQDIPKLTQFTHLPISDQLSYEKEAKGPFLPSHYKNDPLKWFSKDLFYNGLSGGTYYGMGNLFWSEPKAIDKNRKNKSSGQTAVEYLLLLLVVATIAFALMKKLNERLLGNIGDCSQGGDSLACRIQTLINAGGNFKYFRINK